MIRSCVVGLGKMGISHCAIVNANSLMELSAVCDTSSLVLEAFNKYTKAACFSDYKEMLKKEDLSCAIIATPTKLHYPIAKMAMEMGLHVFCEKPFSLRVEEGEELVKIAKEKNLVNQVGYHNRFIGTFNYFRQLIESHVLGDLYHFLGESYGPVVVKKKGATWRSESSEGGGCLYDYTSHVVNLIEYILGSIDHADGVQLKKVYSKEVEDAVYSSLYLENGLSGQLAVNWSDETYRKMSTQITVMGTNGKVISDAQEIKVYLKEDYPALGLERGWNIKYITDLTEPVDFYLRGEEYSSQIDNFAKEIDGGKGNSVNSFENALKTDKLIEMLVNYKKH